MAYTWRHPAPLAAGRKGCFAKQGHDSGWETSMVEKVTDKKLYHVSRSTVQDGVDRWAGPACLAEIPHGFVEINRAGGCMSFTVQPFYT